ncbi:exodeoxyribonuclease X [Bradyrhizobium embrapense]
MIIRPCDVEATSTEPNAEVIEIGAYDIRDGHLYTTGYHTFVKPAAPIPATSSAVHHLTDADVAEAPAWNVAWRKLVELDPEYDGEELVFAAHFAEYERQFFDPLIKARWIDTWKCAHRQWPDLDGHKLQELRYSLRLLDHPAAMPALAMPPHRALPDAYLCGFLVLELLKHQPVETLIQWSDEPAVFTKFDFGKFNGQPLSAADDGFLDWMLGKDFSEDWKWNIKREIERRATAKRREALDLLMPAIAGAATVLDLENWYHGSGPYLAKHGILIGSDEYQSLIQACAARKKVLVEGGQPQFGAAS